MNRILVVNCTKPSLDIELKATGLVFFLKVNITKETIAWFLLFRIEQRLLFSLRIV